MWGRIYPHAVLLIFTNIIFKASCKGNGSLTFLIDDTSSMGDDIKQVIRSVNRIKDIVLYEKSSLIDNMVLVTFNDPGVRNRIVTKNPNNFKRALNAIKVHNEGKPSELDCWEPSMKGLLQALDKSNKDSYIFVFTDAPAKDFIDSHSVIEMCQKKQTQIVFVLTGTLCAKFHYAPEAINVYFDIAVACSGLAFFVNKAEVDKVFGPIEEIIKGNKTVITTATVPADVSQNIPFAIDDYTDYVIVSASGKNVTLKISKNLVSQKEVMSTDNAKVIKLSDAKPGNYFVTVKGKTRTSVIIVGRTDFYFIHGFSKSKPKSMGDTSPQATADATVYLAILVTDDKHSVEIVSAHLLDKDGKQILTKLPLTEISKDFYITDPFLAPSQSFTVALDGTVMASGKPINRTAKLPNTPVRVKIAPKIQGAAVIKVRKGETAVFKCTIESGFPAPKITWLFGGKSGSKFTPIAGSKSVLTIQNVEDKHEGKYKCVAENEVAKDEHVTTLFVTELPKIVSRVSFSYLSTEGNSLLRIPCVVTGLPKPTITWKLNGRVISPSAKYSIEDGALIIRDPKVSDTNSYTCEAKNEVGTDKATFRTYIRQAPQVSGASAKAVRIGSSASIECTVVKGEPKPTISWQFMDSSSSKFLSIPGSDNELHISRVEIKHAGRYKCVALNKVGSSEHTITLVVQDLSKIVSNASAIHESTEGDALLKIPCVAAGLPKPTITWMLNGHVINPSAKYSIEDGALIIRDPKVSDTNSYTCEAKNEVGTDKATFRTYIRQAPQVSGDTAKTVRIGSSATIECTVVKGEPKPTISWQFMDSSSSKFLSIPGPDKVLHISRVEIKHAGRYKCVALNKVGSSEHTITLVVQDLSKIVSNASAIHESTEGDALLKIPCVAAGLPKPTITWMLNGHVINPSAKYSIEDGALIIRDPKVSDTNSYTCEAKNEVGTDKATFRTYIRQAPQVSGVTAKTVRTGSSATIECTVVKGEPKPTISWQFRDSSSSKFLSIPGSDKVLHISRVEIKHAGRYKCVALNKVGSNEHTTTFVVQDLSKIVSNASAIHESTEGDALLKIPCVAAGLPKPTITWMLNGHVINPSAKYSIEDGALIIRDPKVSDTNSYTCEAKNEVGTDKATFRTYIRQAPQVSGASAKAVRIGSSASIECTVVKGEPKPTISWQFMDSSSSKFLSIPGSDNELHISRVEIKHAGRYKCVALNKVGSNEHTITLVVQDLSKIVSNASAIHESTEGDALLKIPCVAAGLPKPTITWMLNGHVINPSAKYSIEDGALIIRDPKVSDTNSYTCEAKNEVGTDKATFRTYIRQAPQVSGVTAKTVRTGSSATIECTVVKGEPKPTISWQFRDSSSSKFLSIPGSDKVLHISRVEIKHAGCYKCVALNKVGSNEHTTTFVVQDLSKIVSNASAIHESTEGDALLKIPCVAAGLPKPTITWMLNGHVINPSAKYSIEEGALIIRDPKVSDTNSYTCEAKNEVGTDKATFRTYIRQAPQVSGVTAKTVRTGSRATIECTVVKGEPKPTISWQFRDSSSSKFLSIPGSDKVLHISRVEIKHAGRYKCVALNKVGSNEHTTTLVVQDLSKIVSNASAIHESTEGDALLKIPCVAAGLPKPTITWMLNGHVINPSAKYSIEDGALIIRDPKVSDTNSYTCEAKNEVGTDKATFRTYIRQAPQVSGVTAKTVRTGSSATIECTVVKGEPKPTILWQFRDSSSSKFLSIPGSDKVLHISRVEIKHAGRYKCVALNKVGSNEHTTTLVVQDLSKIVSNASAIHESTEGDALLKIPCVAAGLPKPTITWMLNGHVINPSAKYSIEEGALIIRDPKVSDTNSYTCEAKNEVGTDKATFRTYIRQAPQVSGASAKAVRIGSSASIECTVVKGEPKPTISWQFMDSSSSKFLSIPGSDKVLHISRVEIKHAGRYKCVALNKVGSNEHTTTLVVQDLSKIVSNASAIHESTEGDALLKIPCVAAGLPKPTITWMLNGHVINPSAKYSIEDGALIIRDPKVSDTNSYTCEAKNEVGTDKATFRTYIRQAPQVSGVTAKTVRTGSSATIECTVVKGEPKPTISWQFRDSSSSKFLSIPGSDKVLHISRVEIKHAGRYKCVALNKVGSNEHTTTLVVQDLSKIVSNASAIHESTEGDALLKIPCVAAGLPKPTITWMLNGHVINPSAKYSIEDGALIIRDPKVSDTNSYTCEAKNEVGTDKATFRTYIRQAPQVSGVTAKTVRTGSSATIECTVVKGEPKPTISWQFRDSSSSKFLSIPGSDKVLHISRVEIKHAGRYKCVALNKVGSNEHTTTLVVQDLSKIVSNASAIHESTEGDALLKIPCVAAGLPKPTITWMLNGHVINPSAKYSIEDGALIIRDPKVSDTNSYTCEAKNEVGTDKATFRTYIRQAPQVSGVTVKKVRMGSPASIECTVEGEPKPTITWQFMDNFSSKFLTVPGSNKVQNILRVENKHAGRYKCIAQNSVGSNEHIIILEVQELPKMVSNASVIHESTEGDASLRIPCVAAGLPKPTITWKLNGHVINQGAKYSIENGMLIIRDPKVSDTDSYTCEAKNEVGSDSATFKTYIRQLPKISGVASKNVRMGNPVAIKCMIVKGEPKPSITWQFKDKSASNFVPISGSANALRISIAENKHAGYYKCVARNNVGNDEHVTTLIVETLPEITINSTTVEGIEGDLALRIPCDVVGIPRPVITWKINGTTITPNEKYTTENGALLIMKPTENDSSSYTCEAKNNVGSVNTTFQAAVEKLPKSFGTEHYEYYLSGETRKLKCEAHTSKSQSVKWFKTEAVPKSLSLSSTSSPPELESLETTTTSNKDYYSSKSSLTTDVGNKEPYIKISNASYHNPDGNYTCRVSDRHGNTQTHTYVVEFGSAPEFRYSAYSLSNWEGDIADITSLCEHDKNAKPIPVIEWTFNGEVLTDLNSAGLGHYTCNVSNVHGSVQRKFNVKSSVCLISRNMRDVQYMPLVLNDEGSWHKLKNTDHYTVLKQEEKITLSCPSQKETSNVFKNFPKKSTLQAYCYKEDSFKVEDNIYKLSDLQCTNTIQPSVIRNNVKCSTETSELISVGYNVPSFLEAYQVCFDREKNMPLYTRVLMTDTNNNGPSASFNWSTYPGIGHEKAERGFTCKDTSSSCCYSKSQLVNAIDFNDGPAKKSTFIDPLNVIPAWLPCDTSKSSWEKINDMVRSQLPGYTDIAAWSGTHTWQAKNGAIIPRYLWKVARLDDDEVMAIIYVNDPSPTVKDIKCKTSDVCYKYWLVTDNNTYCCSLPDFLKSFDIHDSDIGESLADPDIIEESTYT